MSRGTGAGGAVKACSRAEQAATAAEPLFNEQGTLDEARAAVAIAALGPTERLASELGPFVQVYRSHGNNFYVHPRGGSRLSYRLIHSPEAATAYAVEVAATGKPKRQAWLGLPPPEPKPNETAERYQFRLKTWVDNAYPSRLWFSFGSKTSTALAYAAASQLHELTCRMPWAVQGIKSLSVNGTAWHGRSRRTALGGHHWAVYTNRAIYLNPVWWENDLRFRRELARGVRSGFHPSGCGTPESVVTHEFGHLIDFLLVGNRKHQADWRAFKKKAKEDGLTLPSTYAHQDENLHDMEAVAESFAEIVHSTENELSPYGAALKEFLVKRKLLTC